MPVTRHEIQTTDRVAFLIEIVDASVAELLHAGKNRPLYYAIDRYNERGSDIPRVRWTDNPYHALAFSRARDADAFMQLIEIVAHDKFKSFIAEGKRFRQYAEVREHIFEEAV